MIDDIWTNKDVIAYLKISGTTLKKLRKLPTFPKPVFPTGHIKFRSRDIIAWINGR